VRHWYRFVALAIALGLVAAACGDDDDDDATESTAASDTTVAGSETSADTPADTGDTADTGETTDTEAASDLELDSPVVIRLLAETTGESPNAVPYFADGGQFAADEINAAGGVGGQDLDYDRISAPLDQAAAEAAALEALDAGPTAIIGFPSSAQAGFVAPLVGDEGVPTIFINTNAGVRADAADPIGNEYTYSGRPYQALLAREQVEYVVNELGFTDIALLCINNAFGTAGCEGAEAIVGEVGGTIVAQEVHEQDAQNVDAQALAIAGAEPDVVLAFTFPNQVTALVANADLADVPIIGGASAGIAFDGALRNGQAVDAFEGRVYGIDDCVPSADDRPEVQDFVAAFEEEYGYAPDYQVAEAYDYVHMVVAAVEAAGTTDTEAVNEALSTLEYEGICDTYQNDGNRGLMNLSVFYVLGADGREPATTFEIG
jgi:branched-chain amino acid transport system substrate-binding protein